MPGFDALIDACWRDRGFGDFWGYALVAEGAAEAMFETGMHSWDVAAPLVIIEEAGGRVTDVTGARGVDAPVFVGSNGLLHEEILGRLRRLTAGRDAGGRSRGPPRARRAAWRAVTAFAAATLSSRIPSARSTSSAVVTSGGMIRVTFTYVPAERTISLRSSAPAMDPLRQARGPGRGRRPRRA